MSIFARPHYMSDATQFLNQLKKEHPELDAQQRAGRALLWDKPPVSLDEQDRQMASAVKQQAYVYQNKN